jgi:N-acetylmuramoyl-L-alanine amidase
VEIIQREQWGAAFEDGYGTSTLPAAEVYLHHSVTVAPDLQPPFDDDDQAVRTLERIGEQRFGRGISYTFALTPTGRVYEGHSVEREGAHTAGRNDLARAICWVGNYDVAKPTPELIASTSWLLVHGWLSGWWRDPQLTGGHRQAPGAATACPGRHGMDAIGAVNAAAAKLADTFRGLPAAPPPPAPAKPEPLPELPAWNLPGGHYFGAEAGPVASHGGHHPGERPAVAAIQARFVAAGCVPGVTWGTDRARRWCDGRWGPPTTEACRRWFARTRPGQPYVTRIYRDDYAHLSR